MAQKRATKKNAGKPAVAAVTGEARKARRPAAMHRRVASLLTKVEEQIEKGAMGKVSVADFIRLLQLKREIDGDTKPKSIEVTWVDTLQDDDSAGR
jgi:hypothetical protein